MRELGRFGGNDGESGGISPGGDKGLVVEQGTEYGEFERLVIFSTNDKGGVQKLFEFLDQSASEFVLLLDGGEVSGPVCVWMYCWMRSLMVSSEVGSLWCVVHLWRALMRVVMYCC